MYDIEFYPNYKIDESGNIYNKTDKLKTFKDKNGYLLCFLYKDGKRHSLLHHRLVASLFHDNHDNKKYVNHKDGSKTNNHPDNLEWVTPKENSFHSINVLKNKSKGGDQPKLNRQKAELIRHFYRLGKSKSELAREYGVRRPSIYKIINHESYKEQPSFNI